MSDDKESNSRDLITGERLVKPSLVLRAGDGSGKRFAKIKGDQNFKAEGKKALKEAFDEAVKTYIPPQIDSKRTIGTVAEFYSNIVTFVKRPPERLTFTWLFDLFPIKTKFADAILLFVCKADEAEVAAGDLFEELEKVKCRHGSWYCNIWFTWELALLVISKGRKRFTKSVFGPVVDLLKRKSS